MLHIMLVHCFFLSDEYTAIVAEFALSNVVLSSYACTVLSPNVRMQEYGFSHICSVMIEFFLIFEYIG